MDLFQDVNRRTGVTILMVTHDPVFSTYAHRILNLVDGAIDQDIVLGKEQPSQPNDHLDS
jgi:ABC-type lipoprotein export system ATPase subunit